MSTSPLSTSQLDEKVAEFLFMNPTATADAAKMLCEAADGDVGKAMGWYNTSILFENAHYRQPTVGDEVAIDHRGKGTQGSPVLDSDVDVDDTVNFAASIQNANDIAMPAQLEGCTEHASNKPSDGSDDIADTFLLSNKRSRDERDAEEEKDITAAKTQEEAGTASNDNSSIFNRMKTAVSSLVPQTFLPTNGAVHPTHDDVTSAKGYSATIQPDHEMVPPHPPSDRSVNHTDHFEDENASSIPPHPATVPVRESHVALPRPVVATSFIDREYMKAHGPTAIGCAQFDLRPCIPPAATALLQSDLDDNDLPSTHWLKDHSQLRHRSLHRIGALLWLLCPRCFGEPAASVVLYDATKMLIEHKCLEPLALTHVPPAPFDSNLKTSIVVGLPSRDEFTKTFAGPIRAFQRLMHGIDDPQQEVPKCHEGCKHLQLYRLLDNLDFIPFVFRLRDAPTPSSVSTDLYTSTSNNLPRIGAESCHARIAMSSLFDVFGLPGHGTYSGNSLACEDLSNNVDVIASYPEAHHSQVVQMHEATKDYTTHERLLRAVSINEKEDGAAEAPRVATPDGLRGRLRPHQEESLAFMLERERNGTRDFVEVVTQAHIGTVYTLYWSPTLMEVKVVEKKGLADPCPKANDANPLIRGGILADEVGLGKTVSLMALMVANPAPYLIVNLNTTPVPIKATLVVGAVSICKQWVAELKRFLPHAKCLMWYGPGRTSKRMKHLAAADVVVTTYETLKSDFSHRREPLINARFHRVISDECQKLAGGTLEYLDIQADHRWAVSATPINKSYYALSNIMESLGCKLFKHRHITVDNQLPSPGHTTSQLTISVLQAMLMLS